MFYKNAVGALIVYDITNSLSFIKAMQWINILMEQLDHDIKDLRKS